MPRSRSPLPRLLLGLLLATISIAVACTAPPLDDGVPRVAAGSAAGLYCRATGREEPVLLVPGAAWMEEDWEPLDTAGSIVFCDLRGRGRSAPIRDPQDSTLERDVRDLEALRDAVGAERVRICAWAYEAGVALRYALAHPERVERMILVAPLPPRRDPHWGEHQRRAQERTSPRALVRLDALRAAGSRPRDRDAYRQAFLETILRASGTDPALLPTMRSRPYRPPHAHPDAASLPRRSIHEALGDWDWREELTHLDLPVLIVHGERDSFPLAGSEELAAAIPGARLVALPDVGHFPWLEAPETFFATVRAFLEDDRP